MRTLNARLRASSIVSVVTLPHEQPQGSANKKVKQKDWLVPGPAEFSVLAVSPDHAVALALPCLPGAVTHVNGACKQT